MDIDMLLRPYSPWMLPLQGEWDRVLRTTPPFRRPIFTTLADDLESVPQILSITGPRRVGKSTLLRQLVKYLIGEKQVDGSRIIYYSFDDPLILRNQLDGEDILDKIVGRLCQDARVKRTYLFLDEIHRLDRWELYLKKFYDLSYPLRMVISGSASSPIFKKSRESLLGRVKDYHVLPFSFREFLLYKVSSNHDLTKEIANLSATGSSIIAMFARTPKHAKTKLSTLPTPSDELLDRAEKELANYMIEGGFPEVWGLGTAEKKIDYLFDNQVSKVISEDLVVAVELRKPEQLKAFYISLLEQPGREVNVSKLSQELGINAQQIDKYLPMLEMTDLLRHAGKFRHSPVRVRQGSRKYYLVDLALRNAVLRLGEEILADDTILGLYAENLVFNAISSHPILQLDYYRDGQYEVDFVAHFGQKNYWPVEVKYRNKWSAHDVRGLKKFVQDARGGQMNTPIVVTKLRNDTATFDLDGVPVLRIPLTKFLLLFS